MKIAQYQQNSTLHITLQGKFTFADHEAFREILDTMEEPGITHVTINLAGVDFVDSAAMGMLLLAREETAKYNKVLALVGPQGQVKKMFDMANFQNFFTLL